jgi:hypothetical protein
MSLPEIETLKAKTRTLQARKQQMWSRIQSWDPFSGVSTVSGDFQSFPVKLPGVAQVQVNLPLDHPGIPVFRSCCLFAFYLTAIWKTFRILRI